MGSRPISEKKFQSLFYRPKFTADDFFRLMISVMTINGKNVFYSNDLDRIFQYLYKKASAKKYSFILREVGFRDIGGGEVTCPDLLDAQSRALICQLIEYGFLGLDPVPRRILISLDYAHSWYIKNTWTSSQMKKILKDTGIIPKKTG
ncbi:MAG: hypothetical protein PHG66_03590 [Candidatus Colwellbacteria bacterium]|nr:hypothetical protein [Candidatus Colwellbacteria bacterium]